MSRGSRHVAVVIASLGAGGAERVTARLAGAWVSRGDRVTIVTLSSGTEAAYPLDPRVRRIGLDLLADSYGRWQAVAASLARIRAIRRALAAGRPDRILAMLDATNVLTLLASTGLGIPVIVSERSDPSRYPARAEWQWLRRRTYPRARRVVVQTVRAARFFDRWRGVRVAVIPNPVVAPPVSGAPKAPVIAAAGRLGPEKGFDLLVDAFARIASRFPDWRLVIYGQGRLEPELRARIARLGLADRATLAGHAEDLPARLASAGVFVLSSRYEGFPNVLCEAMAAGTPVVAADIASGPREILRGGEDGVLVAPESPAALADGIAALLADPRRRLDLGERGRAVVTRYSLESVLAMWDDAMG